MKFRKDVSLRDPTLRRFACMACSMRLFIITSCTAWILSNAFWANDWMPRSPDDGSDTVICGRYPQMSSNGANPVDLFALELIANSTIGM
jgi:hypothetical protein